MLLRVPTESDTVLPVKPFAELDVTLIDTGFEHFIDISTDATHLYRELHRFAGLVTEDLEREGQTAVGAFLAAINRWQEFSATRASLTAEQQIGLLGELVLLEALILLDGPSALDAWTAWVDNRPGRHDFELRSADIEVKSTRSRTRNHFIHGLAQLAPAHNRPLYVLSLKFEPSGAGPGESLRNKVASIRASLAPHATAGERFEAAINSSGYNAADEPLYGNRFRLVDGARLVPVDVNCPRIDVDMIRESLGIAVGSLVSDVSYRVNFEGLGVSEGSLLFDQVLQGARFQL